MTIQTVSLSLFRYASLFDRVTAFALMGLARRQMRGIEGLSFWKLCGSGTGEGFTPVPNTSVYAILATWTDEETARRQTQSAPGYQSFRRRACETWTIFLNPVSARGTWSGVAPFSAVSEPDGGPVVALTRATIRPSKALRFWRRVPNISSVIGDDTKVAFKIGIGEVPLLHQVTFSIWPDTSSMADFARRDGPHAQAIRAVREGDWFREELYARFRVAGDIGTWNGEHPLKRLELAK
jgi:spheroidene monooxygenase